jgi:hypothetical protein
MGLSSSPEQGQEGRIREVPQEDRCSSMYSYAMRLSFCNFTYSGIVLLFLYLGKLISNIDWCFFSTG